MATEQPKKPKQRPAEEGALEPEEHGRPAGPAPHAEPIEEAPHSEGDDGLDGFR
jgi:hypothetical protein